MADTLATALTEFLGPVVEDSGLFLENVQIARAGRFSTVRVTVDLPDGPGEVDLDTLGPVSHAISTALDEADPIKGQYTLEVSSPGTQRQLSTPRHFRRATGHDVQVTTGEHVEHAAHTVTGTVLSADEDRVVLEVDGQEHSIMFADITEARMVLPDVTPRP